MWYTAFISDKEFTIFVRISLSTQKKYQCFSIHHCLISRHVSLIVAGLDRLYEDLVDMDTSKFPKSGMDSNVDLVVITLKEP